MVVFPEPLNPNNPNFSLGSRPKYKLFTTLTFLEQQLKNVLYNPSIFIVGFIVYFKFFKGPSSSSNYDARNNLVVVGL